MTTINHFYGLCERGTNPSFWGEPLNALTNLFFVYVAVAIYRYYRKHPDLSGYKIWDIHVLTFLTFFIAVGSFSFHTMPSILTELLDITPIVMFIIIFFWSALFRIAKCNLFQAIIGFLAFIGSTHILVTQFPNALNDSIGYLSSMIALIMIALHLNMKKRFSARMFLLAALIGVVSLFFRGVDNAVCDVIPFGTHFLWHSLNALLIYILMKQLIRNINRQARMLRHASVHFA
jgi:hypothetical protein